ncbi:Fpg/Nei family DNA glycosylase [Agromyces atrinae]|uniref:Fpg/Nei family DNA glycosylase n=1 Tax=Agromyces atrinae TaxID=592376 RepID=UPI001F57BD87|nr:DNA-formamidopyrimidine glycosylase family protein [Agromyces atrinae]MCI2958293.1 Fpg/Nei family DNA glycosylase [Agromyces atrinae]
MPEGHSVHRITRQFARNFVGHRVEASSPQGRFAAGAAEISGRTMIDARAVGKQMFLEFDDDLWLRVHLGMYGAWDFAGDIRLDATIASANGRMGQTNQRGTILDAPNPDAVVFDADGENSLSSIGAPRRTRVRMAESEKENDALAEFPPPPIGQVRVRLLTENVCADLRGPTACEVRDSAEVEAIVAKLGPDPLLDDSPEAEERFTTVIRKKPTPIGLLLMDQSVVSGIGNVYRAEMLFRANLDPHTPGKLVPEETVRALWHDWAHLLRIGVETGQMMTMDGLEGEEWRQAMANRADRHWVYKREGLPCRVCGTNIVLEEMGARKLYWCPTCQR